MAKYKRYIYPDPYACRACGNTFIPPITKIHADRDEDRAFFCPDCGKPGEIPLLTYPLNQADYRFVTAAEELAAIQAGPHVHCEGCGVYTANNPDKPVTFCAGCGRDLYSSQPLTPKRVTVPAQNDEYENPVILGTTSTPPPAPRRVQSPTTQLLRPTISSPQINWTQIGVIALASIVGLILLILLVNYLRLAGIREETVASVVSQGDYYWEIALEISYPQTHSGTSLDTPPPHDSTLVSSTDRNITITQQVGEATAEVEEVNSYLISTQTVCSGPTPTGGIAASVDCDDIPIYATEISIVHTGPTPIYEETGVVMTEYSYEWVTTETKWTPPATGHDQNPHEPSYQLSQGEEFTGRKSQQYWVTFTDSDGTIYNPEPVDLSIFLSLQTGRPYTLVVNGLRDVIEIRP